ncbi:hypothetical protein DPMN_036241 [Dreissena polymorpha]|uniref:Uncharacterized protein n=1 Tax=Dreissena polymorpha TaxID=45954 RepID=A0A9D4RLA6_DREPO|nr:hypothetical protein DPMN_036241 [Dreissena polymorpha]
MGEKIRNTKHSARTNALNHLRLPRRQWTHTREPTRNTSTLDLIITNLPNKVQRVNTIQASRTTMLYMLNSPHSKSNWTRRPDKYLYTEKHDGKN